MANRTNKIKPLTGAEVVEALDHIYPDVKTPLVHGDPFQLLIATVLSAQSTDVQINRITPALFAAFPNAQSMSKASIRRLERLVKSSGFFHVKARRIKQISAKLARDFDGKVPQTMEDLLTLPGVGRKTANIVLSAGFDKVEGVAVDTHVYRLSHRLGLSDKKTPDKIEMDLMAKTPKQLWPRLTILLILHGRNVCFARKPHCEACILSARCLYFNGLKSKTVSQP